MDVLKPDGSPLLVFRRGAPPADACEAAYPARLPTFTPALPPEAMTEP